MRRLEVLVVGAGPAGIAAAAAAAEAGRRVLVLDDNPAAGGQIWREGQALRGAPRKENTARRRALDRLARSGAEVRNSHRVFAAPEPSVLQCLHESPDGVSSLALRFEQLIIATGARERFLPFPGWTLPGVFGAGGLQALVQGGFSVAGKRVVVAGTGPLLLAVAAHLRAYGAEVVALAEQAPPARLLRFGASLWRHPGKLWQGARYRAALGVGLGATPFRMGCWPTEALPGDSGRLRAVRLTNGAQRWEVACDLLACGFHLAPNQELPRLLGCTLRDGFVEVDAEGRTSVPHVFCAGEPTGIAGLDAALLGGRIAGLACAGRGTGTLRRRAARERRFAMHLERAFALRDELRALPAPETIICRCEDVAWQQVRARHGWTEAKLQTRCGMGSCQGRVCGPAVEFLLGWRPASVRPPLFPVPLEALYASEAPSQETA